MTVKRFLLIVAVAAAGLFLAAPASAHAGLVESDPEDGAVLDAAPESATLTFSEPLDADSTDLAFTGPSGDLIETGDPTFDGAAVTLPLAYTEAGDYVLAYRIVSLDGHRVDGSIGFTVEQVPTDPDVAEPETPGASTSADAASPAADRTATPVANGTEDDDSTNIVVWVLVVAAAAAAVAAGFILVRRAAVRG